MRRIWSILLALLILAAPVRAAEDEKWVALTFDDGPSGALTERLLDGLAARDVKATFFVCGYRVAEYPAALRRIAAEGHEIGLHSEKHDYMQKMDYEAVRFAAQEAKRLGLELGMANCSGWANSGGPWNTPEHAMKTVCFTATPVAGGARFEGAPAPSTAGVRSGGR